MTSVVCDERAYYAKLEAIRDIKYDLINSFIEHIFMYNSFPSCYYCWWW